MASQTDLLQHDKTADVGTTFAIALPIALAVLPFLTIGIGEDFAFYNQWMVTERGAIEHATVFFAAAGCVLALLAFSRRAASPKPWLGGYMLLFALGFIYIAGEEMSWGQHLFGWESSEWFAKANRQQETNFHNLHQSLDRVPKSIIGAGIVFSGVLVPLFARFRPLKPASVEGHWYWLWPTPVVRTTASLFLVIWLIDRGLLVTGLRGGDGWNLNFTEHRELMMVYFLALYCGSLYLRLRARNATA